MVVAMLITERISIAVIGLLAAIYGQSLWSVFMGVVLMMLILGTSIKVK